MIKSHAGIGRSAATLAVCLIAAFATNAAIAGEDLNGKDQAFVELTCNASGIAKLRTLSPMQIQPAWRDPKIASAEPISLTRQIMRIRDYYGDDGRLSSGSGSFTHRMARCHAGQYEVVVRVAEDLQVWGYEEEVSGFVRIWIDQRPANLSIPSLDGMTAKIDLHKQTLHACADEVRELAIDNAPAEPPKQICETKRFHLGDRDPYEFPAAGWVPGPGQSLILTEAKDAKLCGEIGPHLDGGPFPEGYAEPTIVAPPADWLVGVANSRDIRTYRFDANNDGKIDDVSLLEIDQHIYSGTMLIAFERDSVLTGRVAIPSWIDVLEASFANDDWRDRVSSPFPKEFEQATNAYALGGYQAGRLDVFVHGNTSYIHVSEGWSTHQSEGNFPSPGEQRTMSVLQNKHFEHLIVKLTAHAAPEIICKFVNREEFLL